MLLASLSAYYAAASKKLWRFFMPAGKEVQPECISQKASSGHLNCSCSRSRDLTAINPVVPEMMKIAALAVSTAHSGNMSFAFLKSVTTVPCFNVFLIHRPIGVVVFLLQPRWKLRSVRRKARLDRRPGSARRLPLPGGFRQPELRTSPV